MNLFLCLCLSLKSVMLCIETTKYQRKDKEKTTKLKTAAVFLYICKCKRIWNGACDVDDSIN